MSRIIINEGTGPRPVDLSVSRLVIGGSADCDVRVRDPAAAGSELVIEATPTGHRVVRLRGALLLNEEPCEIADLLHNDTLHVGDSLILYKNPDARRSAAAAALREPEPAPRAASELELVELEELPELELEELAELDDGVAEEPQPPPAQPGRPPR